jgi:hypothetical protein
METISPHVRTIPVRYAPSQAPCPTCGTPGRRKATLNRLVRTIAYKQVVFLVVTYGEYRFLCTLVPALHPKRKKLRLAALQGITPRQTSAPGRGPSPLWAMCLRQASGPGRGDRGRVSGTDPAVSERPALGQVASGIAAGNRSSRPWPLGC